MRNLHALLELFATDCAMAYCEQFDEVKSVLEYCDRNVKPFKNLYFRPGNDSSINELVSRLQKILVEKHLVDADSFEPLPKAYPELRKILMFLLANTDATYKYNLRLDTLIAHVFEICPLLPKFLFITLVWDLRLDTIFYETLSYTPCWFAFQYFDAAADSLKYVEDQYEVLVKIENLVKAICVNIARSELRYIDAVDKKIIFGKLYDCAMNYLRQFYTPDAEKFKKFSRREFFRYSGFAIKHMLQMLLFAFDVYETPEKTEPSFDIEIYEICLSTCKKMPHSMENNSQELKNQQLKIISALLNSLQNNVMLVTIDVFAHWVEVDMCQSGNLQMVIGEMAYKVCDRMTANRSFAHDVEQQLQAIRIRPKSLSDIITGSTLGEILRKLDEDLIFEEKKAWFDELFKRTVAFGNDECLQTIKDNVKLMSMENCKQILDYLMEIKLSQCENENDSEHKKRDEFQMDLDCGDFDELTSLILLALNNFNNEHIIQLLDYQVKLFGDSTSICCQSEDFQQRSTEFLNKFTSSFDFQQFLILCFESAGQMWAKFFDCACHNGEHIKNFCATVRQARPFSNLYFNKLFKEAMRDYNKLSLKYFPELLSEIYFQLYYPEQTIDFIKEIVNRNVNAMLEAQEFDSLLPIIKSLNLIGIRGETQSHKPINFGEVTTPVLLMIAQIMDKARWDLITYTDVRDEIVRECILFIENTSKKFLPVASKKDRKWITKEIKDSYRPFTQYYFQRYDLTPDQSPKDFDHFLIPVKFVHKTEAEMFLIMNYVRCTMKETEWLARSERLLPHISDVMLMLGATVNEAVTPNAINNYRHCLANYANIVRKFLIPKIQNSTEQAEELVIKVLEIIKSAPTQSYEEIFMSFQDLLLEIPDICVRPLNEDFVNTVRKSTLSMSDCKAKEIFLERFQTLCTTNSN